MQDTSSTSTLAPRWGVREAVIAWIASVFVSIFFVQGVLSIGNFTARTPVRPGGYIGRAVAQRANGDEIVNNSLPLIWQMISLVPGWIVLLGVAWYVAGVLGLDRRGWHIGKTLSDIPLGFASGIFIQIPVLVMVGILMSALLEDFTPSGRAQTLVDGASASPIAAVALVLGVAVGAPIVEELFYRGIVQGALVERFGWVGVFMASIIFGAVHLSVIEFFPLTVVGLGFGLLAYGTGRLLPAIIAHMTFNAYTLVFLFASSSG